MPGQTAPVLNKVPVSSNRASGFLLGRAITTSVDLTLAIASSPHRRVGARTASAVITAVMNSSNPRTTGTRTRSRRAGAPDYLLGPGSAPILTAGYEGFTKRPWSELADTSARVHAVLFRLYGAYNVAVALLAIAVAITAFRRGESWAWWALLVGNTIAFGAAMTYDRIVGAIGPFEILEYVGIAGIYGALAVTAPFFAAERSVRSTG